MGNITFGISDSLLDWLEDCVRGFVFVLVATAAATIAAGSLGFAIQFLISNPRRDFTAALCWLPIGMLFAWCSVVAFRSVGNALREAGAFYKPRNGKREGGSAFSRLLSKLECRTTDKIDRFSTRVLQLESLGFKRGPEPTREGVEMWTTVEYYIASARLQGDLLKVNRVTILTCTNDEWGDLLKACTTYLGKNKQ